MFLILRMKLDERLGQIGCMSFHIYRTESRLGSIFIHKILVFGSQRLVQHFINGLN